MKANRTAPLPTVAATATILEALRVIDRGALAIALVLDENERVIGTLTDGDIRRAVIKGATLDSRSIPSAMKQAFVFVSPNEGRSEVLDLMRAKAVQQVPILDAERRLLGMHTLRQIIAPMERSNAAVILAGGMGTRMRPLTNATPKPMLPIAGRPMIERLLLHIMSCGIRRFFITVGPFADLIENHLGDGSRYGCSVEYLREAKPLGTGGALSLLPEQEESVLVANGDLVTQCDFQRMFAFHESGEYEATIGIRPYNLAIEFGVVTVRGERVTGIVEKPVDHKLINAGLYVIGPEQMPLIPRDTYYPITDLFSRMVTEQREVGAYVISEDWADIADQVDLRRANGTE